MMISDSKMRTIVSMLSLSIIALFGYLLLFSTEFVFDSYFYSYIAIAILLGIKVIPFLFSKENHSATIQVAAVIPFILLFLLVLGLSGVMFYLALAP
jgi:hypothetical protein